MQRLPFLLSAYRFVTRLATPLAPLVLRRRLARGKEDGGRLRERLGYAGKARPDGRLIWIHGASVGECVAALPLIAALQDVAATVLVTSGTTTSAKVMASRLSAHAIHQYVPIDIPAAAARFLDHWRPDAGLFIDSDLWPNLIFAARARGIPLAVVNARMSERSFRRWRWVNAGALFAPFSAILAQDEDEARRYKTLGARDVRVTGSLKADADPLSADPAALSELQKQIGSRPVFLAAQTHAGEEETLLPAADLLTRRFPNLLTVIVPRHPERGGDIVEMCGARAAIRRSLGQAITPQTRVYIADTIGEMGLFYRLSGVAFVGGSLIAHGGQNPLEPAKLGRGVLAGPHTFNFITAYRAIFDAQGMGRVETSNDIAAAAEPLLADAAKAAALGALSAAGAKSLGGASAATAEYVRGLLKYASA